MHKDEYLIEVGEHLDAVRSVSDDELSESVVLHGTCMRLYANGDGPQLAGDPEIDRAVTARICESCPVRFECLEWEMRSVGADTRGPWGLLGESDRRHFHELWSERRDAPTDIPYGLSPEGGER
jgi:hypothetical protein